MYQPGQVVSRLTPNNEPIKPFTVVSSITSNPVLI